MNFIKTNWFKLSLLILSLVYLFILSFSQYIESKAQNLRTMTELRQCVKDFSGDTSKDCINIASNQRIRIGHIIKW